MSNDVLEDDLIDELSGAIGQLQRVFRRHGLHDVAAIEVSDIIDILRIERAVMCHAPSLYDEALNLREMRVRGVLIREPSSNKSGTHGPKKVGHIDD